MNAGVERVRGVVARGGRAGRWGGVAAASAVAFFLWCGALLLHASQAERALPTALRYEVASAADNSAAPRASERVVDVRASERAGVRAVVLFGVGLIGVAGIVRRWLPRADPFLLPAVGLLAGIGLLLLARIGPDLAMRYAGLAPATGHLVGHAAGLAPSQLRSLLVAAVAGLLVARFFRAEYLAPLSHRRYGYVVAALILIAATALFGTDNGRGVKLWLDLGFMTFQTVELVKLLAVLFLAGYLFRHEQALGAKPLPYSVPFLVVWALAVAALVVQRDLGPALLFVVLFMAMLSLGTGRSSPLTIGAVSIGVTGWVGYHLPLALLEIVRRRIDMWLDPFGRSEQMSRVLWAVSSGGWFGAGLGGGLPYDVPQIESDLPFAGVAEELGLVGALAVLSCVALLVYRLHLQARWARDSYVRYLFAGFMVLFAVQTLIIVGGSVGLVPLTGITLPFVSHGGSSLLVNAVIVGWALWLSDHQARRREEGSDVH